MLAMLVPLLLSGIIALVHFFSEEYAKHAERFHVHTTSFSAGMFLGIIFLALLPEFFKGSAHLGEHIFLIMLSGFALFHLGEKFIYQHIKNKDEMLYDLAAVHVIGFFINHFVLGITLFLAFTYEGNLEGFLIFIPLLLHTFSSSLSLNHLDRRFERKSLAGLALPFSPIAGVLFASFLNLSAHVYYGLFSFVIGAMLYVTIRDLVPREESGKPLLFLTGVLISVLAITILGLL